jgi:hypothetical protein
VPVAEIDLAIDQNASFTIGPQVWIGGGQGVNITGSVPTATFRQLPTDAPLVTLTSTVSAFGVITYLPPVLDYPYLPPSLAETPDTPNLITLWPWTVQLTLAGVQALPYPACRWKFNMTWPDGTSIDVVHGNVTLESV